MCVIVSLIGIILYVLELSNNYNYSNDINDTLWCILLRMLWTFGFSIDIIAKKIYLYCNDKNKIIISSILFLICCSKKSIFTYCIMYRLIYVDIKLNCCTFYVNSAFFLIYSVFSS